MLSQRHGPHYGAGFCRFRKKTGPTTFHGEYAAIILIRNLRRGRVGLSSALKMDVCDTPRSRAACARRIPACLR